MPRITFVAALGREVAPLIRGWNLRAREIDGRQYKFFENGGAALVCGGIGAEAARRAAEAVIQEFGPERIVSVGFAGALDREMRVGEVLEPRTVINAKDGSRFDTQCGEGILVSIGSVAGREQKKKLQIAYDAAAVDMEAAAVGLAAQSHGIGFGALKAISDESDVSLPAMERFITSDGQFRSAGFGWHIALRPWMWGATVRLARNSARASRALCGAMAEYIEREGLVGSRQTADSSLRSE